MKFLNSKRLFLPLSSVWGSFLLASACASGVSVSTSPSAENGESSEVSHDHSGTEKAALADAQAAHFEREREESIARGGRLYDKWWAEATIEFSPDDKNTPKRDGKGGPFGNGTLPNAKGESMLNTGHDYRLKNLFGWDLQGAAGIYGEKYQNKSSVLSVVLLEEGVSVQEWSRRLSEGFEGVPAYGKVLNKTQIEDIAAFITAMASGKLVRAGQVWSLSENTPKNYTLKTGGDPERGHQLVEEKCSMCHGKNGTNFYLEDAYSLGSFARAKSYEAWLKILNGQPGTKMRAQVDLGLSSEGQANNLLDILSALCDRKIYPRGEAIAPDVPDGDARCGEYLK